MTRADPWARAPGRDSHPVYRPFGSLLQTQPPSLQSQQQEGNILKGFSLPEAAEIFSHKVKFFLNSVGALLSSRCKNTSRRFLLHTERKASAFGMFQTRVDNGVCQPCFSIPVSVGTKAPCELQP